MSPWVVRLPPVLLGVVVLHTAVFPQFRFFDVAADALVLFGVAAGIAAGAERGAVLGFVCGLIADCFLQTPFGLSALVLCLVAWVVGVFHTRIVHAIWWIPVLTVGVAAAAAVLLYAILGAVMGESQLVSTRLLVIVPVVAVLDAALSPLAVRALRWCLDIEHRGTIVLG